MLVMLLSMLDSESDRRDFAMLYERYHEDMELAALRILPEQKDAEDAMQNAFVQVIRHYEKVSEIPCEELPFWLICIVKNEARIIQRKNSRMMSLEDRDTFAQMGHTFFSLPLSSKTAALSKKVLSMNRIKQM